MVCDIQFPAQSIQLLIIHRLSFLFDKFARLMINKW